MKKNVTQRNLIVMALRDVEVTLRLEVPISPEAGSTIPLWNVYPQENGTDSLAVVSGLCFDEVWWWYQ